jgi:pimeloyl-ACP methyl ester carboxylesterase
MNQGALREASGSVPVGRRFYGLIDEAMREIDRRSPDYLGRFGVSLPEPAAFAQRNRTNPGCHALSAGDIEGVVDVANRYLADRYRTSAHEDGSFFAEWVGMVGVDAYRATDEAFDLDVVRDAEGETAVSLQTDYDLRATPAGTGYYIRKRGKHPVLLINATGLPIEIWRRILGDAAHDFRLIVPIRRHGDLFLGGIASHVPLEREASDLISIIDAEAIDAVHVLAWCNGARLAVEATAQLGRCAASLTLIAPMFTGIADIQASPTPLELIIDSVAKTPKTAEIFAVGIAEMARPTDWSKVSPEDRRQREEIFRLPNRRHLEILLKPLLSVDSLMNVARRVASDERHPTLDRLSSLKLPLMVILGSHDGIVRNQTTIDALRKAGCRSATLLLRGAGHDLHDLQYRYVRYAVSHFVEQQQRPMPMARLLPISEPLIGTASQ